MEREASKLLALYARNRDAFYMTLSKLDYEDLLSLCQVSKRLKAVVCDSQGEPLWKTLWLRDISSKPLPEGSYKDSYITAVEKYRVNPEDDYGDAYREGYDILGQRMKNAWPEFAAFLRIGDEEGTVRSLNMWQFSLRTLNERVKEAAFRGYTGIVERLFESGANDYVWSASQAARGGHLDTLETILELGGKSLENDSAEWRIMLGALNGNHPEIVEYLLDRDVFVHPDMLRLSRSPEITEMLRAKLAE